MKKLPEKFQMNCETVCVQGLGFVGSAMALAIAKNWTALIIPGLLVGTLGNVIGNFFGILMGTLFGA